MAKPLTPNQLAKKLTDTIGFAKTLKLDSEALSIIIISTLIQEYARLGADGDKDEMDKYISKVSEGLPSGKQDS